MKRTFNINEIALSIFQANQKAGWWDDMNRSPFDTLQLVSTEVAEATEGERKNLMDDKLPHRLMGEVEIADVFIRAADIAGRYGIKYHNTEVIWCYGTDSFAAMHLAINQKIIQFANVIVSPDRDSHGESALQQAHHWLNNYPELLNHIYSSIIDMCYEFCEMKGYDLEGAITEKLAFNAVRLDHTREHRATENGKKI